jgi:transcription antitermination factor NusA-like protein
VSRRKRIVLAASDEALASLVSEAVRSSKVASVTISPDGSVEIALRPRTPSKAPGSRSKTRRPA